MGGRGATSTSGAASSGQKGQTQQGWYGGWSYPEEMDALKDKDGHISLNIDDYDKYTQEEVENFITQQDYEVQAFFNPDGKLIFIDTQFNPGHLSLDGNKIESTIKDDMAKHGVRTGYIDFHNHPMNDTTAHVPSDTDIRAYAYASSYFSLDGQRVVLPGAASVSRVKTSDGHFFELSFGTGSSNYFRSSADIYDAFKQVHDSSLWRVSDAVLDGKITSEEAAYIHSETIDKWLKLNAGSFGFKYRSSWH